MKDSARPRWSFGAALAGLVLAGCVPGPKSGRGFQLPDGDPVRGRQAFIDLQCIRCHTVAGETLPAPAAPPAAPIVLGGEVTGIKTYGRLVTAIIHPPGRAPLPRHRLPSAEDLTRPQMKAINDRMTVQELIDLVTFLQPHYREALPHFADPGMPPYWP